MQVTFQVNKNPNCSHIHIDATYADGRTKRWAIVKEDLQANAGESKDKVITLLRNFVRQNNLSSSTPAVIKAAIEAAVFEV